MANKLMFEVGLDGAGFERGINQLATTGVSKLKSLALQAFGVYSVSQALNKTMESAEELVTTSKSLDITVEKLQILRQAAKDNLVDFSKVADALAKIDVLRDKALGGGPEGAKASATFGRLGVTDEMLRTMTAAQIFMGPLRGTAGRMNEADIAEPLKEVFGKSFRQIIPVLKTDFDELGNKMKSIGAIMDGDTAFKLKALGDEFSILSQIVAVQVGPALLKLAEWAFLVVSKGGGKVAQASAELGNISAQMSGKDWFNKYFSSVADMLSFGIFHKQFSVYDKPINFGAAMNAGEDALKPWQEAAEKFKKLMDDAGKKANQPFVPPLFNPPDESISKMKALPQSDALVRVGNFLGSGRGQIESIAIEHVKIARQQLSALHSIATNTAKAKTPGENHYPVH